ncbi:DUF1800 domain-containing protein [Granulicella arctica]|uniref:Uncharacterized protein (DUF1800 family) n=1 Tax=Granulicella arctica TaxID=940613 RepID=A0A7Y9PI77_9BACT|nr:DUF1800 domain-containing protein [Granulicella arctica]NYF80378.1 uncharacterized protein (DUF1800 family) [Granulicella arctica]
MKPASHPVKALTGTLLCILMAGQPLLATIATHKKRANEAQSEDRILHALNRFTFGPRPGEVAEVEKLGLKNWFDRQLNPSTIDDSALDARLASYPAMHLSQEALMQRYPSPQLLRQIERQDMPLPNDPLEHTIYADQLAFYKMAQERKAAKTGDANAAMKEDAALPGDTLDPTTPAMADHIDQLYSGLEAVKIINLPPDQRMARILAMSPKELIAFRDSLSRSELAEAAQDLSPEQKELFAALPGSARVIDAELLQTRLLRDIYSDRQLEAVMTDFWLNHFNVYLRKNQNEPYLLPGFEREVIRPNALGNFEDLLVATAKSPAMLVYLDNWTSIGPDSLAAQRAAQRQQKNTDAKARPSGLNENYARELMELHTLGVNGGYTQADVTQVARVFTGWTVARPNLGAAFQFEPNRHEPGPKQVLGHSIQPAGEDEGLQVLHILATSPATAHFISTELAQRFVSDTPPPALVDRMTQAFLASNGDIKTVLRTLFDSPEFWSPSVVHAKVKTPLEFVVSAVRASDTNVVNPQPLIQSLTKLGMPLYGMQTPNGYSWLAEPWVSTGALVSRMNFALVLASDRIPGVRPDWTQLLSELSNNIQPASRTTTSPDQSSSEKEKRLELLLLGQPVSDLTRATVLQQFQDNTAQQKAEKDFPIKATNLEQLANTLPGGRLNPPFDTPPAQPLVIDKQAGMMAGLLIGSPEFQRR